VINGPHSFAKAAVADNNAPPFGLHLSVESSLQRSR